jgi:shikimate dehydrogenase
MITADTRLVGLIGWPVAHSLSPAMHNAAFNHLGINWKYVPLPVHPDMLAAAVQGLAALGFAGANVTIPHKTAVMTQIDGLSETARQIGAVNTLLVQEGNSGIRSLDGTNTDSTAFIRSLQRANIPVADERVVVCGAGGAARAVVFGLLHSGAAQVLVLSRRIEAAQQLKQQFQTIAGGRIRVLPASDETFVESVRSASLLVNATPVGMSPHAEASIWPDNCSMPAELAVLDLVYAPLETKLLKQAKASGAQAVDGLSMLIEQGAEAFTLWTDRPAPISVMRKACERQIQGGCQ